MSESDWNALEGQPDDVLADWYCKLNSWEWPEGIPDPEPLEYRQQHFPHAETRGAQIMAEIERRVGEKHVSYWWNVKHIPDGHRMTDETFEEWYKQRWMKKEVAA